MSLVFLCITLLVCGASPVYAMAKANKQAKSDKTFKPGAIWPDDNDVHINAHGGGMLQVGKTTYWFGEHKIACEAGNVAHVGVHCYSSDDLYDWVDEGIVLEVSDDPKSDITEGCVLERPKVIYNKKTRKYVMWFHLEEKGNGYASAMVGVATSSKVTGPYEYQHCFRPDGEESRDMTIFADDDGKAYLFHSSENNATMHVSPLTDDYLDTTGKFVRIFEGRYMEAPTVFKHRSKYYFIGSGCTGWAPNAARCAVADRITGPWTELGNPCDGNPKQIESTFDAQSTYVLPVPGKHDAFIFMADRWCPSNAIDGRYVWLPIQFDGNRPVIRWLNVWDLGVFGR